MQGNPLLLLVTSRLIVVVRRPVHLAWSLPLPEARGTSDVAVGLVAGGVRWTRRAGPLLLPLGVGGLAAIVVVDVVVVVVVIGIG